jgi:esterase/lipase
MKNRKKAHSKDAPFWLKKSFQLLKFLSPWISSRIATYLFFTPLRFKMPKKEIVFDKEVSSSNRITHNKKSIQLYEWGNSEKAVLVVHGWQGRATQLAHLVPRLLQGGYKVVGFDAPGHGKSSGFQTNIIEFTELIIKMKKLYPEIQAIIGHSIGANACVYAISKGLNINKCILIAPPISINWILKSYCTRVGLGAKVEKLMSEFIEKKFNIVLNSFSIIQLLKTVKCNGLIVHCVDDRDVPLDSSIKIHQYWKQSKMMSTKGLGHRRILKNKKVANTIYKFIEAT